MTETQYTFLYSHGKSYESLDDNHVENIAKKRRRDRVRIPGEIINELKIRGLATSEQCLDMLIYNSYSSTHSHYETPDYNYDIWG